MKTLIKNVKIVDGTMAEPYIGNIVIENDTIASVGGSDDEQQADMVIDGMKQGVPLCAAPGFIDTHSHSDLQVLTKPELLPKIMQGITTEVLGQDGISLAPLPEQYIKPWEENLAGLDGYNEYINWHFHDTAHYLKMVEQAQPSINECYLVPHGNVRMEGLGLMNAQPDEAQMKSMQNILQRELDVGTYGLSTGLIYMPCAYAKTEELINLCKVVAKNDGVFVIHQRSEADTIVDSMKEVIRIGRESGVHVHFSHFKVCGRQNWHFIEDMVRLLEQAEHEGIDVSFDQYPYVAGSTMLGVILPPWVHDGGTEQVLKRLQDTSLRRQMIHDMEHGIAGWDNFVDFAGMDNIYITSVKTKKNQDAIGLSLTQLAQLRHTDPYNAAFDLLYEEENAVGMVDFYGTEDHVKLFLKRPEMNACTDGLMSGKPHPRVFGAFPRILGKYVREEKTLTLQEAVYKLTKKAASAMHIENRGELKPGYAADIVLFDEQTICDKGTFVNPVQYPDGIEYVFVNGVKMVDKGVYQKEATRSGRVLYKKS